MVRFPPRLLFFVTLTLLVWPSAVAAATARRRAPARLLQPVPKVATRSVGAIHATPKSSVRLSAGARGPASVGAEKAALEIPDLRTQTEVAAVVQALREVKGVQAAVIDLNTHLAVVDYDPRLTELDRFLSACKDAGFEASEYRVESRFPKPIKLKGG